MTTKYQNVLAQRNSSTFVEVGERDGSELNLSAKANRVTKGGVSTKFAAGKVSYTKPVTVEGCDACVTQEFQGSFNLGFNVPAGDVEMVEAFEAEVIRIFALVKADLVHGIMPASSSNFAL